MKRIVLEQRLGFVATVSPDRTPNLSPKGTTTVWDDQTLMFADIRSPQTVANLLRNPSVEVNVVDPFARRGYRFKGTATVHEGDETYVRGLELLRERGYAAFEDRVRAIVLVRIERALPLLSPAYDAGATEDELRRQYVEYYAELHAGG